MLAILFFIALLIFARLPACHFNESQTRDLIRLEQAPHQNATPKAKSVKSTPTPKAEPKRQPEPKASPPSASRVSPDAGQPVAPSQPPGGAGTKPQASTSSSNAPAEEPPSSLPPPQSAQQPANLPPHSLGEVTKPQGSLSSILLDPGKASSASHLSSPSQLPSQRPDLPQEWRDALAEPPSKLPDHTTSPSSQQPPPQARPPFRLPQQSVHAPSSENPPEPTPAQPLPPTPEPPPRTTSMNPRLSMPLPPHIPPTASSGSTPPPPTPKRPMNAHSSKLSELYGNAVHAYYARDYEAAAKYLSSAITQGTRDPRCYYFRALTYLNLGTSADAERDFRQGAALEFTDEGAAFRVSEALQRVQGAQRMLLEKYRSEARQEANVQPPPPDAQRQAATHAADAKELRPTTSAAKRRALSSPTHDSADAQNFPVPSNQR